jgi:hypothetical protein
MPECMNMEKLIDRYSSHYGIDPDITEQKDIIKLYVFQMCRNEEAWIMFHKTKK